MAKNIVMGGLNQPVINVDLSVTVPATNTTTVVPKSGTAVLAHNIPGVAEADVDVTTGLTPVNTSCVAELPVNGIGASGNAAISVGDVLYMQTDGTIDKNSGGSGAIKFGTAFGNSIDAVNNHLGTDTRTGQVVASGASQTIIRVWVGKIN